MSTAANTAGAFGALEHIDSGDWDNFLPLLAGAIKRRKALYNHKKQPSRVGLENHQRWVWMHGPGRSHWEVVGTGALLP